MKVGLRSYGGLYNHPTNGVLVRVALLVGDLKIDRIRAALAMDQAARSKLETGTVEYVGEINESLRDGERLIGIMGALSLPEARVLLNMSHILTCNPGDALIRAGHVSRTLYMLLSGSLEVRDGDRLVAATQERGTLVGEIAFFSPGDRILDVVAGPDGARVLALSDRVLRDLIASHGPVAAKFLHFVACGLAGKLRGMASLTKGR